MKMKLYAFEHHPASCIVTHVTWHGRRITPIVRALGDRHYISLFYRNVTTRIWLTPTQEEALQAFKDAQIIRRIFPDGIE